MREAVRKIQLSGWATPKSELEIRNEKGEIDGYDPKQIIFESESPAVWGLGTFPHSTRQFDLAGALSESLEHRESPSFSLRRGGRGRQRRGASRGAEHRGFVRVARPGLTGTGAHPPGRNNRS